MEAGKGQSIAGVQVALLYISRLHLEGLGLRDVIVIILALELSAPRTSWHFRC